jgi:hypothetical protein
LYTIAAVKERTREMMAHSNPSMLLFRTGEVNNNTSNNNNTTKDHHQAMVVLLRRKAIMVLQLKVMVVLSLGFKVLLKAIMVHNKEDITAKVNYFS